MVTRRNRRSAALVAALFGLTVSAAAAPARAALQAQIDSREIRDGDSVDLVLRATGDDGDTPPDLAPLEKDFEVVGTSQNERLSIVNGHREESRDWIVRLRPRSVGDVVIPAIHAGSAASQPISLKVVAASAGGSNGQAGDLFVETEVDDATPIVQGEVRYTVRVFDGVGLREGQLSDPHADNATLTPRGDIRTYETTRGGKRYRVHERDYSLFPQSSGDVTIPLDLRRRLRRRRLSLRLAGLRPDDEPGPRGAGPLESGHAARPGAPR
jgi:hypothetical protein